MTETLKVFLFTENQFSIASRSCLCIQVSMIKTFRV